MRFEKAWGGWRSRRPTQEEAARLPGGCERTFRRSVPRLGGGSRSASSGRSGPSCYRARQPAGPNKPDRGSPNTEFPRPPKRALFDFIEGWYNRHRRYSALGYLSPDDFERVTRRRAATDAIARAEAPNHPRGRLPAPGTRENPLSPVLAHHDNRGESHRQSTRPG